MPIDPEHPRCWFLTGPTASGKSAVGVELAERLGAEILSLDSMAVYRGLDIGTAKPSIAEQQRVPHHLIDLVDPGESFSVAQYLATAERCANDILARGRTVLFVGGSPLYLKAVLRGLFEGPPADPAFRHRLETEARERGGAWLHKQLQLVDPVAAARLHERDLRRMIRALEVYEQTGMPISQLQQQFERAHPAERCRVFVLDWPRGELNRRIDRRVEAMLAAGWVDELRRLLAAGVKLGRTARQAVGYRELLEYLDGQRSAEETTALIRLRTRQFAKRQMTWFHSLSECRTAPMVDEPAAATAERILSLASEPHN